MATEKEQTCHMLEQNPLLYPLYVYVHGIKITDNHTYTAMAVVL